MYTRLQTPPTDLGNIKGLFVLNVHRSFHVSLQRLFVGIHRLIELAWIRQHTNVHVLIAERIHGGPSSVQLADLLSAAAGAQLLLLRCGALPSV